MDRDQQNTYDTIVRRCKGLSPSVDIAKHIKPGTLKVRSYTLDGMEFEPLDPEDLKAELGGRMKLPGAGPSPKIGALVFDTTRAPRPANASMISMQEDPKHWALKASFGATVGEGFREQWQPPPKSIAALLPERHFGSDRVSLAFGQTGQKLNFTALHAAVSDKLCNLHIDQRGFVVDLGDGAMLSASLWGHFADELLLKTIFRDWLDGKIGDNAVGSIVVEVVNRLSLRFPDAENGFAGLSDRANRIKGINDLGGMGKTLLPIGLSLDVARTKNTSVQANYYWHEGQQTLTLSWGGTFGNSRSR